MREGGDVPLFAFSKDLAVGKLHVNVRLLIAISIGIFPAASALATEVTYVIDSSRSILAIAGVWDTIPIAPIPQNHAAGVGSISDGLNGVVAAYYGMIRAERDESLGTLRITGGIVAALDTAGQQYIPLNSAGASASYAFYSSSLFTSYALPTVEFYGAIRDFSFSPLGALISTSASSRADSFSATIHSGRLDYSVTEFNGADLVETNGSSLLTDELTFLPSQASVARDGDFETLTIPTAFSLSFPVDGQTLAVHFTGTIVATVPEPASLALSPVPVFLLYRRRRARHFSR